MRKCFYLLIQLTLPFSLDAQSSRYNHFPIHQLLFVFVQHQSFLHPLQWSRWIYPYHGIRHLYLRYHITFIRLMKLMVVFSGGGDYDVNGVRDDGNWSFSSRLDFLVGQIRLLNPIGISILKLLSLHQFFLNEPSCWYIILYLYNPTED